MKDSGKAWYWVPGLGTRRGSWREGENGKTTAKTKDEATAKQESEKRRMRKEKRRK